MSERKGGAGAGRGRRRRGLHALPLQCVEFEGGARSDHHARLRLRLRIPTHSRPHPHRYRTASAVGFADWFGTRTRTGCLGLLLRSGLFCILETQSVDDGIVGIRVCLCLVAGPHGAVTVWLFCRPVVTCAFYHEHDRS